MTDVGYSFHASLTQYEIKKGRLVIFCEFLETEVPVFLVHVGVEVRVVPAVPIATVIVHPQVKSVVSQIECK
jgi:hypothetical protein